MTTKTIHILESLLSHGEIKFMFFNRQRSQKVWKLKIVLLISKIFRTFYDIFDFELWTILLGIDMPNFVRQYAWVVKLAAFM